MMQQPGLIDLSQVRLQREVKEDKPEIELEKIQECLTVYRNTLREAIDVRFVLMQSLPAAATSQVQLLPNQPSAAQEIIQRLKFMDGSISRLTDLITASEIVIKHHYGKIDLRIFPQMFARLEDVKAVIVDNRDKKLGETTQAEGMLVAGFRDLERWLKYM